jgi:NTE family protein
VRAIVLSGGGSRGAYQAGVAYHLLAERRTRYDIITGTSVGALNGAFLAMFRAGEETQAAEGLKALWWHISDAQVWRHWGARRLAALWRPSVYRTGPLQKLVRDVLDPARLKESGKRLRVGAVSLKTGKRRVWTESDPHIREAVLASSSFPVFFEPIAVGGEWYTDDGLRENTPANAAIKLGADSLHVVQCGAPGVGGGIGKMTALNVAKRALAVMGDEVSEGDLDRIDLYSELARLGSPMASGKREIAMDRIYPSRGLDLKSSLDFRTEKARANWQLGLDDARRAVWR